MPGAPTAARDPGTESEPFRPPRNSKRDGGPPGQRPAGSAGKADRPVRQHLDQAVVVKRRDAFVQLNPIGPQRLQPRARLEALWADRVQLDKCVASLDDDGLIEMLPDGAVRLPR